MSFIEAKSVVDLDPFVRQIVREELQAIAANHEAEMEAAAAKKAEEAAAAKAEKAKKPE